jgi:hypothetical protein
VSNFPSLVRTRRHVAAPYCRTESVNRWHAEGVATATLPLGSSIHTSLPHCHLDHRRYYHVATWVFFAPATLPHHKSPLPWPHKSPLPRCHTQVTRCCHCNAATATLPLQRCHGHKCPLLLMRQWCLGPHCRFSCGTRHLALGTGQWQWH